MYSYLQLPYNSTKTDFVEIIDQAHSQNKTVVINRPFNMGHLFMNQKVLTVSKLRHIDL